VFLFLLGFMPFTSLQAQLHNTGQIIHLDNNALVFVEEDYTHADGEISGNGNLELKGNWNNTSAGAVFRNADGLVILNGSAQAIKGNRTVFPSLKLGGDGAKMLESDTDIGGTLYLENNYLHLKRYSLNILNPSVAAIQRSSGFIITEDGGFLARNTNSVSPYLFPLGAIKNSNVFAVGSPELYRPVVFEPSSSLPNTFSANLNAFDPNSLYPRTKKLADVDKVFEKYFYLINHSSGTSNFGFKLYQNTTVEDNSIIVGWNYSSALWEKIQTSLQDGVYGDGLNRMMATNFSSSTNNLPVSLASSPTLDNPFTFYNAFSPDGDGKNDTWQIKNIEQFPENSLTIFNRWGDEVYQVSSYSNNKAWDGGSLQPGTYFYMLNVKINGQSKSFKGFITMVKKN